MASWSCRAGTCGLDLRRRACILGSEMFLFREAGRFALILAVVVLLAVLLGAVSQWVR